MSLLNNASKSGNDKYCLFDGPLFSNGIRQGLGRQSFSYHVAAIFITTGSDIIPYQLFSRYRYYLIDEMLGIESDFDGCR